MAGLASLTVQILTWQSLHQVAGTSGDQVPPAVVLGAIAPGRTLALACLTADFFAEFPTGSCLWIGSHHLQRPVAWLPLLEQRLDARPLRPAMGATPWPGVNPFALTAGHAADWLLAALVDIGEEACAAQHESALRAAVTEALAVSLRRGRPAPDYPLGLARTAQGVPEAATGLARLLEPVAGRLAAAASDADPLRFLPQSLTVIAGHEVDVRDRVAHVALTVLAFVTAAMRAHEQPMLLVCEDWWSTLHGAMASGLARALNDLIRGTRARVIVAETSAERYHTSPARGMTEASAVVIVATTPESGHPSTDGADAFLQSPAMHVGDANGSTCVGHVAVRAPLASTWVAQGLVRPALD